MARFELGMVLATPGAIEAFEKAEDGAVAYLRRHLSGDWGDLDEHDKQMNEDAVRYGGRILSAYRIKDGTKIWIITEADRSVTTILLPSEY